MRNFRKDKTPEQELRDLRIKWAISDDDLIYFDGPEVKLRRGNQEWVLGKRVPTREEKQRAKKEEQERKKLEDEERKRRKKTWEKLKKKIKEQDKEKERERKGREEEEEERRKTGEKPPKSLEEWRRDWAQNGGDGFRGYMYSSFGAGPSPDT